jgi:hypothetical protein
MNSEKGRFTLSVNNQTASHEFSARLYDPIAQSRDTAWGNFPRVDFLPFGCQVNQRWAPRSHG